MQTTTVNLPTPDGSCDALLCTPDTSAPSTGVVLLSDILGMRDAFVAVARTFVAHGLVVLLPNIYYRAAPMPLFDHDQNAAVPEDMARAMTLAATLRGAGAMANDGAAYARYLAARPEVRGRPAMIGHCNTGAFVLRTVAAHPDVVSSGAIYHGSRLVTDDDTSPHHLLAGLSTPLYVAHASIDGTMPAEKIAVFDAAAQAGPVVAETETLDGAHGFAIPGHRAYDPALAAHAHARTIALIDRHAVR